MLYALVFSICQSAHMAYFSTKIVVVVQQATVTVLDAVTPTSYQPVGGVAAEAKPWQVHDKLAMHETELTVYWPSCYNTVYNVMYSWRATVDC